MKKLSILLIIVGCSFCTKELYYADTWAGTSSNQMVTRAALNDAVANGIFTANESFPSDGRCVTKAMAQQYVNISTISGYAINQLVPKSVFTSAVNYYAHNGTSYFWGDGWSGMATSTQALTNMSTATVGGATYAITNVYSLYNRTLDVGDEIFYSAANTSYPIYTVVSGHEAYTGYWFYDFEQNAALEVTNTQTGRQYIITKVFPAGLTNVSICLEVTYTGLDAVSVRAFAASAVDATVTVNWSYSINDAAFGLGTSFIITNGSQYSSAQTITHSGAISTFNTSIDSFSPTASSTQNYVSGGQCF